MAEITIYTTAVCPYCVQAKQLLDKKGATYSEVRVDTDPDKLQEMLQRSSGKRSVPQIFIGDTHVGGCDDLYALERDSKLDNMLVSD